MNDGSRSPWWEMEDPLSTLVQTADELRSLSEPRRLQYRTYDDLYDGRTLFATENTLALGTIEASTGLSGRTLNFARNAIDFVHSKCTAEVPTVRAAGHGANAGQRLKARRLSQFIAGAHDDLDLDGRVPASFLTALRTGTGCTKVSIRDGRPTIEVTSPREFYVDSDDARFGDPRVLYQIKPIDRRALAVEFPDGADAIMSAARSEDTTLGIYDPWYGNSQPIDAVDRYEAWVRPVSNEPGRHIVATNNEVLLDEEWTDDRFPVAFLRLGDPRPGGGFWGMGLMQRLDAAQWEIDELVAHIGRSIRENNLKIFVDDASDISPEVIADPTVGTIIKTAGGVPEFVTPNAVSPQEIQWLTQLVGWLYQMAGMDEASAGSSQASKLSSGRAILFQHDMQTQRYVDYTKRIGQHVADVIERVLDAARRLSEDDPSWTVRYSKGSIVRQIDWAKVDMDRDMYVIELEEVSPVPDTFAGRMQQAEQDAAEGRVSQEWFAQLRQDPDLWRSRFQSARADADYVDAVIDDLLDPDLPMPRLLDEAPRQLMIDALRTEILTAVVQGEDPRAVERLQRFASMVAEDVQQDAQQQQQSQPAPNGVLMPQGQQLIGGGGQ